MSSNSYDEPVAMGEVSMDSSDDESESDGEETEEDRQNYKEALKRADKFVKLKHHKRKPTTLVQSSFDSKFAEEEALKEYKQNQESESDNLMSEARKK